MADIENFNKSGILPWRRGMIAWIEVREEADHSIETYYEPTMDDIEKMCQAHGFNLEKTRKIITERDPEVHGFLFEGNKVRAYQKENT